MNVDLAVAVFGKNRVVASNAGVMEKETGKKRNKNKLQCH